MRNTRSESAKFIRLLFLRRLTAHVRAHSVAIVCDLGLGVSFGKLLQLQFRFTDWCLHACLRIAELGSSAWILFFVAISIVSALLSHWLDSRKVLKKWTNNLSCNPTFFSLWDHILVFALGLIAMRVAGGLGFEFEHFGIEIGAIGIAAAIAASSLDGFRPEKTERDRQSAILPIHTFSADKLDRIRLVLHLRRLIRHHWEGGRVKGSIIGLEGVLGSGKTSVLNLLFEKLRRLSPYLIIVRVEPWAVRGPKATQRFLIAEIASALNAQYNTAEIGETLGRYLAKVDAGWPKIGLMARIAGLDVPGLAEEREILEAAIARTNRRLLVVIDDMDRLLPDEVYSLLRLLDSLRTLPNCAFLLAYDRDIVAERFTRVYEH